MSAQDATSHPVRFAARAVAGERGPAGCGCAGRRGLVARQSPGPGGDHRQHQHRDAGECERYHRGCRFDREPTARTRTVASSKSRTLVRPGVPLCALRCGRVSMAGTLPIPGSPETVSQPPISRRSPRAERAASSPPNDNTTDGALSGQATISRQTSPMFPGSRSRSPSIRRPLRHFSTSMPPGSAPAPRRLRASHHRRLRPRICSPSLPEAKGPSDSERLGVPAPPGML